MLWYFLFIASSALTTVLAAPASHVLHEKRDSRRQLPRRRVEPDAWIPIRVALRQSNLDAGHERLMQVSHPRSPDYGKHLSREDVHNLFAPVEESIKAVKDWLLKSGIKTGSVVDYANKGWLAVDMPARQAELLFHTQYYEYYHTDGARIGCDSYYLPSEVAGHVDFVKPGVKLSGTLKKRQVERRDILSRPVGPWEKPHHIHPRHDPAYSMFPGAHALAPDLQNCGVNITPTCIKALYGIPPASHSDPVNAMGLFEHFDAFAQEDIDLFFKTFAPNVPQGTSPTVLSVDGGTAPVAPSDLRNGAESDSDLDISYALIYPQNVTVYEIDDLPNSSGETNKTGFLNTWLDSIDGSYCSYSAFGITGNTPSIDPTYPDPLPGGFNGSLECGVYELTRVVSISYEEAEIDLPKRYVERQCNEFMKLGLQGHSIVVPTGDYGVAIFPGANGNEFGCLSGFGQNGTIYNPNNPCGCPYVTAVGGTRLYPNQTVIDRESAMQVNIQALHPSLPPAFALSSSGGGFSNYFTQPSYQRAAVQGYLSNHNTLPYYLANEAATNIGANGGVYNRAGRAYPDVSANAANLLVFSDLTVFPNFGTSSASPIFGSVLTLLNEERTAVGKGPIGFVNPVLYEYPEVLNDITNGSNPNCGSSGFQAAKGWDPVTGLGTPNFPKMLELFLALP
ncbi:putative protease S8 tripeptidyl peptidase I [Rhizodiscina lignyota]|uniref:Protease S8 tripeptidyl peptidase I n=1 Tax=Rhizodiscina lignyota TaxID=1504668 RepID=A0A9P4I4E6_9PEZI|nr:putative protease S8 tripeptidyl peptidase I [Rhizodiscina lignyota]